MTEAVYVNASRTRIVPEGSPEAAFRVHVRDARRMGLLSSKADEPAPAELHLTPPAEPEVKQEEPIEDKQADKPVNKSRRRRGSKKE